MKRIIMFCLIILVGSPLYGNELDLYKRVEQVKIFESTRKDIEKLFKSKYIGAEKFNYKGYNPSMSNTRQREYAEKNPPTHYSIAYKFKTATLNITYSKGKCSDFNSREGYDVAKDIVIDLSLSFTDSSIKLSRLGVDLMQFDKLQGDSDVTTSRLYSNKRAGIFMRGGDDFISSIEYRPTPYQELKYNCKSTPTDLELTKVFNEKRNMFEKLVKMSNDDSKVTTITYYETDPVTDATNAEHLMPEQMVIKFSKERWQEYKELFDELNLETGLSRSEWGKPVKILFIAYKDREGYFTKGYVYTKEKVEENDSIDSTLRKLSNTPNTAEEFFKHDRTLYKKIADNWYIYLSYHLYRDFDYQ